MATDVTAAPFPYRARARSGEVTLADSSHAVLVEEPGGERELYFPLADIHLDHLADGDRRDLLRSLDDPPPGLGSASEFAAFDRERAQVEVVDTVEGEPARDATIKRFPPWGDAADLIRILDVRPIGEHRFSGAGWPDARRPVVEGSQMLAQSIVAALRLAPGRRPVFASMAFLRVADAREPIEFDLETLSAGRTFTCFSARVSQAERLCAAGTLLLDATAPDLIRHEVEAAPVVGPYESEAVDMAVTGRDVRVAGGTYSDDPESPTGPPVIDAWVRFRSVPEDPALHAALLTQFTGHMSIAAAMRPHPGVGQRDAHRTLSTAINAITVSLHDDVRADWWMRYHHLSTFAGDGMTHAECRVHREDGGLLASFTVEGMVRGFGGSPPVDEQTAL